MRRASRFGRLIPSPYISLMFKWALVFGIVFEHTWVQTHFYFTN